MRVDDRDDRVLPLTRVVSVVIIPFLVVAFAVLVPVPDDTKRLFAWEIKPTFTAMALGSVYLGGAYFFARASVSTSWLAIKGGFLPVGLFASFMGIATVLHWSKFTHHHVAFWLWAALYFTTPFLIFTTWWRNRALDEPVRRDDLMVPRMTRVIIATVGGAAGLTGLTLFVIPGRMSRVWPWALTPLTGRVVGAVFMLGVAGLGVLVERRWAAVRIMVQVEGIMLALIGVAVYRARHEFRSSAPLTWILGIGLLATALGSVALYGRMSAARRRKLVDVSEPAVSIDATGARHVRP